jgi:hypothetical protein
MSTDIDSSSVTLSYEAKDAACDFRVGSECLLLHCTKGATLSVADAPMSQGLAKSFQPALTWKGKVRVKSTGTELEANNELTAQWTFGFLQFALVWVEEYVYAGWIAGNGSIRWDHKQAYTVNPCLDAEKKDPDDTRWPIMGVVNVKRVAGGTGQYDVECTHNDHPHVIVSLRERNMLTNKVNYLYSARRDVSYWIVFVAKDPSKVIRPLAQFNYHTIWHAETMWGRSINPPVINPKYQAFLPSAVSMGGPSEPAIAPLVTKPADPTANEQSEKAYDAWDNRRAPIVFQFASHITGMRASFAREPNEG